MTQQLTRDDGLAGKVALISGGASGIGRALAIAYARAGVTSVIGHYPGDPHDPEETVAGVREAGGCCEVVEVCVRDTAQVDNFAREAVERCGRLDIAVAAAGILRKASLPDLTDEAWEDMLQVDLGGVMRVFRSAVRYMTHGGSMVAVSSIAGGVYGWGHHTHYAASKAGVMGITRSLAVELAGQGIRVNTVVPGLIRTPQSLDAENSLGEEGLQDAGRLIPAGRVGTDDEAARVIRFLTSDDAAYITGQELVVDGGLTIQWPS